MANLLGPWGEEKAAEFLRRKGYALVASNYRCKFGEIDLIVKNRRYLVFVEVKLRRSDAYGRAGEFVDRRKQEKLRTAAQLYLAEHPTRLQPRFDVVEVYAPQGLQTASPRLHHLENAF